MRQQVRHRFQIKIVGVQSTNENFPKRLAVCNSFAVIFATKIQEPTNGNPSYQSFLMESSGPLSYTAHHENSQ